MDRGAWWAAVHGECFEHLFWGAYGGANLVEVHYTPDVYRVGFEWYGCLAGGDIVLIVIVVGIGGCNECG